ncbi:MAG: hypothetical protein NT024_16240, partial [Proteobacteria bacterium]|nr:hypothetical protein [Pseudomonadota bacterium]
MNIIVALAAEYYQVRFGVWATSRVLVDVMQLKNARIGASPPFPRPTATHAGIMVARINSPLYRLRNESIVGLGYPIQRLKNVLSHPQIWATSEASGYHVALLGTQLPCTAGILLRVFGDIRQLVRCYYSSDILTQETKQAPLAPTAHSANAVRDVPASRRIAVRRRRNKHVLIRSQIDAALRIGRRTTRNLISVLYSQFANSPSKFGNTRNHLQLLPVDDNGLVHHQVKTYALSCGSRLYARVVHNADTEIAESALHLHQMPNLIPQIESGKPA